MWLRVGVDGCGRTSTGLARWRAASAGEPERLEDLVGRGEKRWELVGWERGVLQQEDDGLASHAQDDDPEDLSLVEPVGVRVVLRCVRERSKRDEDVALPDDLAVELAPGDAADFHVRRGLVGRS